MGAAIQQLASMPDDKFKTPPDLGGVHVLLVDNNPDALEVMQAVINYAGSLVTVASSAREALRTLAHIRPDVIVSDIAMPGEDGYWLIRQVRSLAYTSDIPAIAVTVYASPADRQRAFDEGFQAHLPKPVDPWELCQAIVVLTRYRM